MVAELKKAYRNAFMCCSLAKISMVAEPCLVGLYKLHGCSLAKISMVAELSNALKYVCICCSLAKISMVAEPQNV